MADNPHLDDAEEHESNAEAERDAAVEDAQVAKNEAEAESADADEVIDRNSD